MTLPEPPALALQTLDKENAHVCEVTVCVGAVLCASQVWRCAREQGRYRKTATTASACSRSERLGKMMCETKDENIFSTSIYHPYFKRKATEKYLQSQVK